MRADMSHVIVERPRLGGGRSRKGRAVALEDLPLHEGMRRPWMRSGDWKTLNENLSPLRRCLERQVGRPWSKVYSEISRHLRANNAVQQHVRDHIKDFVALKPRANARRYDGLWHQPLYVDPRDGILKRTARLRPRRPPTRAPAPTRIAMAADRELRLLDGIWYELTMAELPRPEYRAVTERRLVPRKRTARMTLPTEVEKTVRRLVTPAVRDVVVGMIHAGPLIDDPASWNAYRRAWLNRRYAVRKRTLSRRELARHGLCNVPSEP